MLALNAAGVPSKVISHILEVTGIKRLTHAVLHKYICPVIP
jgi:hypothetical protein